jgi:hypothetical protein
LYNDDRMKELLNAFEALPASRDSSAGLSAFHTLPVLSQGPVLIAKTALGEACMLVRTTASLATLPPPLRLENLTVQHGIDGRVYIGSSVAAGTFSLVVLRNSEHSLVEMFVRFSVAFAHQIPADPTAADVSSHIQKLVSLLQHLRKPSTKTIQGLWSELFLIATRDNPERWVNGWHVDPMGLHDFMFEDIRVEVKSSAAQVRTHRFSHNQLSTPSGTSLFVASVLMERSAQGVSVFDLAEKAHALLSPNASLLLDSTIISTLGLDYLKAADIKFDLSCASDSLLFFPLDAVPRLSADTPDRVTDVSYTVRLIDSDGSRDL